MSVRDQNPQEGSGDEDSFSSDGSMPRLLAPDEQSSDSSSVAARRTGVDYRAGWHNPGFANHYADQVSRFENGSRGARLIWNGDISPTAGVNGVTTSYANQPPWLSIDEFDAHRIDFFRGGDDHRAESAHIYLLVSEFIGDREHSPHEVAQRIYPDAALGELERVGNGTLRFLSNMMSNRTTNNPVEAVSAITSRVGTIVLTDSSVAAVAGEYGSLRWAEGAASRYLAPAIVYPDDILVADQEANNGDDVGSSGLEIVD